MQLLTLDLIKPDAQKFGEIVIDVTGCVLDVRCSVLDFSRPGILLIRRIYTSYLIRSPVSIER
jgi:hypothetical protein